MKLNPYLTFNGNCEEAMNYYKDILGGEFLVQMRFSEAPPEIPFPDELKDKIMHTTLQFSGCSILASDSGQGEVNQGNANHLSINVDSEEEALAIFKGLAENGQVAMPFETVFWGGKFGMLVDKYGVQWMVSTDHKPE